jgi:hypothetical protein
MLARPSALTFFLRFLLPFLGCAGASATGAAIAPPPRIAFSCSCSASILSLRSAAARSCFGDKVVMFIREPSSYLVPRIASFAALATRNLTTRLAGILIAAPVAGLRPMRALRLTSTSLPRPGIVKEFLAFL